MSCVCVQCVPARSALLQALRSHGPPRLACPAPPGSLGAPANRQLFRTTTRMPPSELALRNALHPRAMSHPPLLGAHHTTPRTGVLAWHRARPLIGRGGRADKHTWIGRTDLTIWVPSRAREAWPPSHTRPSPHPPPHTHTELPRPRPPPAGLPGPPGARARGSQGARVAGHGRPPPRAAPTVERAAQTTPSPKEKESTCRRVSR